MTALPPLPSGPLAQPGVGGLLPNPGGAQAQQGLVGTSRNVQGPPTPDQLNTAGTGAAPMPKVPPGGYGAPMPSGGNDVTDKMGLNGAQAYTDGLANSADHAMSKITAGALPGPEIQNQGDLAQLQAVQRQIQLLSAKAQLAEVAVKYWGIVYNNENAKAWRDEERKKQEAADKKAEREAAAAEANAKALAAATSAQPRPQMDAAPAPLPQVYEVMNGVATILVPGAGAVTAHAGATLPDGTKVVAIGSSGVIVDSKGRRVTLGFVEGAAKR